MPATTVDKVKTSSVRPPAPRPMPAKPKVRAAVKTPSKAQAKASVAATPPANPQKFDVINHSWADKKVTRAAKALKAKSMYGQAREYQVEAFELLKDEPLAIHNGPTGSGKSWSISLNVIHKLEKDPKKRAIIGVPQSIIGNGFLDLWVVLPDNGHQVHWKPDHNLCDGRQGTIDYLIGWLKGQQKDLNDRILVCTHATLVHAYKRLKAEGNLRLLNNLVLWIDEAHHVQNAEFEDMDGMSEAVFSNGIGELVKHIFDSKKNIHLGLATASFFRGDRTNLLTPAMEKKFVRFNLPYDRYFASMANLRSFSFSFAIYNEDYIPKIREILLKGRRKVVLHFPRPGSNSSRRSLGKDKYADIKDLEKVVDELYGDSQEGHYWLDLVDERGREEKKAFTQEINKDRDAVDLITAIGMFTEGANWVHAEQSIIVGHRNSLVELLQTAGRLFRDVKGKKHVEIIQLLPFAIDQTDREAFRQSLNNNIKAIMASMILENVLVPALPKPKSKDKTKAGGEQGGHSPVLYINALQEHFPDEVELQTLFDKSKDAMLVLADESKQKATKGDYIGCVQKVVKRHRKSISDDAAKDVASEIVRRNWTMGQRMKGIDVSHIDFDLIQEVNPVDWVVSFTTKACGIDTFRKLRVALSQDGVIPMPEELHYKLVNKLIDDGHLTPSPRGYRELAVRFNKRHDLSC